MRVSLGATFRVHPSVAPAKRLRPGDRHATVVAVAAQKGGVGKTTTSVSLAAAWARFHGKRVLLVDLDPQGHVNLALRAAIDVGGGALSDVLADPKQWEVEEIATSTAIPGLFATPADPGLLSAEDRMASRIGKELLLKKALDVTRTHYDLIVLDCPPNVGALTVNALVAADQVLIPANAAALALAGVSGLLAAVEDVRADLNPGLGLLGVVLTRLDARTSRTNDAALELAEDSWGEWVLPVRIGVDNALAEAQLEGVDVYGLRPASRAAEQYRALATWILERLDQ